MKRWRYTTFPSEPVGSVLAVADHPCFSTRAAYTLWRRLAQTSPMSEVYSSVQQHLVLDLVMNALWTSLRVAMLEYRNGLVSLVAVSIKLGRYIM